MRKVVTEGTGKILQSSSWALSGKSGTAQVIANHKHLNNQWFIGYGPTEKPQYVVSVLVKNKEKNSSNQATLLFRDIMNYLSQHSKLSR
ncbi:Penicillin-binding protein 4B [compost metagenome]